MAQVIWNPDIDVYNSQTVPLEVAKNIAKYLSIDDVLSFGLVSKNTFKAANDPYLWVGKLKKMNLWNLAIESSSSEQGELVNLETPLTCMDRIIKSPKGAKKQVLMIHKYLKDYYDELSLNKPFNQLRIFKDFQSPEDQARLLRNLRRYNKMDPNIETRLTIEDKISTLFEIFENALLRELEINFDIEDYLKARKYVNILVSLQNEQTLIDFFLQKNILDNEKSNQIEQKNPEKFFTPLPRKEGEYEGYSINEEEFRKLISDLSEELNYNCRIIDIIFPETVPVMFKVCEEITTNQIVQLLMSIIETSREKKVYPETLPFFYEKMTTNFINELNPSKNMGPSYKKIVRELLDMLLEPFVAEYVRDEVGSFKAFSDKKIHTWNEEVSKREEETSKNILKHVKVEAKNDFLTSFRKVFTINGGGKIDDKEEEEETYSEIEAKAKILIENIKSLSNVLSVELFMRIINEAKNTFRRLLIFREFTIESQKRDIYNSTQETFKIVIDATGNEHLKPGFDKALQYLKTYKPSELQLLSLNSSACIEPLVLFCELINMADMILQMIDIFYKEEILNTHIVKNENSILNPALQSKKKLEALVDNYVADGLMSGIDILMAEIEKTFIIYGNDSDYDRDDNSVPLLGPTEAATRSVRILEDNIDLLVGCTDNSVVEVFQQEIAERFFQLLTKSLKKSTISVAGAVNLIADLNLYYEFAVAHIKSNKRYIIPLFEALKKVGNIYLISTNDSKAIGKLVSDLSKFNGIFSQDEIYEFVQRRKDWLVIKRDVEKEMYGLSLIDCTIA